MFSPTNESSQFIEAVAHKRSSKEVFLKACNFIKKRHQPMCFPVNIAKFLSTPFYRTTLVAAFELKGIF